MGWLGEGVYRMMKEVVWKWKGISSGPLEGGGVCLGEMHPVPVDRTR
jgi:hypothetical protein